MSSGTAYEIEARIGLALRKYGAYASTHEALGVISEEFAELVDAIRANALESIREEALDLAACALKLAQEIYCDALRGRSGI